MEVDGYHDAPADLPLVMKAGAHCRGGWVGSRADLDGCRKSRPTGIRSPNRPARNESLYRLSYPGPLNKDLNNRNVFNIADLKREATKFFKVMTFLVFSKLDCPCTRHGGTQGSGDRDPLILNTGNKPG